MGMCDSQADSLERPVSFVAAKVKDKGSILFQPAPVVVREATHLISVFILNTEYEELRKDKNYKHCHDIPEAICDMHTVT